MKRTISLVLAVMLLAFTLAACGTSNTPSTPDATQSESKTPGTQADASKEDITLRLSWWGGEERHEATLKALDLYHELNPNITIVGEYSGWDGYLDKLLTQLASGTAPEIMQTDGRWYYDLVEGKNVLVDANTLADKIDLTKFDRSFLDTYCSYKGFLVGVPTGMNSLTLLYNRDFFAKHNIPENTKWTWEGLLDVGERVHKEDSDDYLFVFDPMNVQVILRTMLKQQIGDQIMNEDYTTNLTKEALEKVFAYWNDMLVRGVTEPLESTLLYNDVQETNPKWVRGEIGMTGKHCSLINKFQGFDFEIETTNIPVLEGAKDTGITVSVSSLLSVNAASPYIDEISEFINWFMTDEDAIKTLGEVRGIHASADARKILSDAGLSDPVVANSLNNALSIGSSFAENALSQNQEFEAIMIEALEKVGFGIMTPSEAADYIMKIYTDKLAEMKAAQ